jgi:hypothetical protein
MQSNAQSSGLRIFVAQDVMGKLVVSRSALGKLTVDPDSGQNVILVHRIGARSPGYSAL